MLIEKTLQFALNTGASWVLWLLIALSVMCVGIAIERTLYIRSNASPRGRFEAVVSAYLAGGSAADVLTSLKQMGGFEARVLLAGFNAADAGYDPAEAMQGTIAFERLRMERGMLFIGTVASNAPFIGLLGTVIGIMVAFHDLSALESKEGAGTIMAGISEALVSTAAGLIVAIPAVVLYNLLMNRVKSATNLTGSLGQLVLSRLSRAGGQ